MKSATSPLSISPGASPSATKRKDFATPSATLISAGKKKIVLNLSNVDYIDSSGVGELVSSYTAVRNSGGELKLYGLTKKVQDVLYITKLYTVFDIKDDEFTAVKSFDYFFAK